MEEKERYILGEEFNGNRFNYYIKDTQTNILIYSSQGWLDLLNQQDKRIKELEEQLKNRKDFCISQVGTLLDLNNNLLEENQQLKQQLAESEVKIANLEVLLLENANDRKAIQEFKIGEDEYDLTDEDARNSLCWEVEELKQQLSTTEKALELACLVISKAMCPNGNWDTLKKDFAEGYKEQAKEMLENE